MQVKRAGTTSPRAGRQSSAVGSAFSASTVANMRRSRWARLVYLIGLFMMGMSAFGEDRTMILATFIALGTVSDVRGDAGTAGDPAPCI